MHINSPVTAHEETTRPSSPLSGGDAASRWELYRLLADPVRPRLLALASVEELGVGELAELLREGQPKISRHASALRDAGLLVARRQSTWTLLRLAPGAESDPVVADAVSAGVTACRADGTLARIDEVLAARDAETRAFFARDGRSARVGPPAELLAYLSALGPLFAHRGLAVDVGTGDGALLDVLSPIFEKVIAVDRSAAQLALASERTRALDIKNVELVQGEVGSAEVRLAITSIVGESGGADLVFASRVLHHAPAPLRAVNALSDLLRPPTSGSRGGALVILDYEAHEDEALRRDQADLWLGFEPKELKRIAKAAGLVDLHWQRVPRAWQGEGPDRHLSWQIVVGFRG